MGSSLVATSQGTRMLLDFFKCGRPAAGVVACLCGLALENNPELMALRQQHGIAAAGVVIARTYPFNPVWEDKTQANNGPLSAGITNRVSTEHLLLLELELRGQGSYRRQGATAALSR